MSEQAVLPDILLVTGSEVIRKSISRLLSDHFNILFAANADQAWDMLLRDESIRLVLSELQLTINDDALLERIRHANSKTISSLPVLLLVSENDDESALDTAFMAGASDYIDLPLSATDLRIRVRLHARIYGQYFEEADFDLDDLNTPADLLTGLMQEKYFYSRLQQELGFSIRHQLYISTALVRIDNVDSIEDKHGRKVVRAINRAIARIIGQQTRREDAYGYINEDTFAILYPVTNGMGAQVALKRLLEKINKAQFRFEGEEFPITVSVGLYSALPSDTLTVDQVLELLEQRVSEAERLGGSKIVSSKAEQEQVVLSLEQGLKLIRMGDVDKVRDQIPNLLNSIHPLLELAQQYHSDSLQQHLDQLKD